MTGLSQYLLGLRVVFMRLIRHSLFRFPFGGAAFVYLHSHIDVDSTSLESPYASKRCFSAGLNSLCNSKRELRHLSLLADRRHRMRTLELACNLRVSRNRRDRVYCIRLSEPWEMSLQSWITPPIESECYINSLGSWGGINATFPFSSILPSKILVARKSFRNQRACVLSDINRVADVEQDLRLFIPFIEISSIWRCNNIGTILHTYIPSSLVNPKKSQKKVTASARPSATQKFFAFLLSGSNGIPFKALAGMVWQCSKVVNIHLLLLMGNKWRR